MGILGWFRRTSSPEQSATSTDSRAVVRSEPLTNRALQPYDGPPPPWRQVTDRTGGHGFVRVVGEQQYQETLQSLSELFDGIGRADRNFIVEIIPEPNNSTDPNAVKVVLEGGSTIGYLSAELARSYQPVLLRQASTVRCPAQLRGGLDDERSRIGVVLDFIHVHELKNSL